MPRYDQGFRGGGGYSGSPREALGQGMRPGPGTFHDADFRPPHGLGGGVQDDRAPGEDAPWGEGPVSGPSRYGLGPYYRRLQSRCRPDDELKQEVEEALFYDTWVDAEAITVDVKDGVVVLRGELPDYDEVRYATDDAWDVEGVRGVRCELQVDPEKRKPTDWSGGKRGGGRENGGRTGGDDETSFRGA